MDEIDPASAGSFSYRESLFMISCRYGPNLFSNLCSYLLILFLILCRYVFSGSMLGTEFKGISSFPVGYVEQIVMRPMDFEEFCWAVGVDRSYLDQIRDHLRGRRPVDDYLHGIMMRNYRAYVIAGGMPEVVQTYVDSGFSLARTRTLQKELVRQYAQDIGKYAKTRSFEVRAIYDQIPVQLEGDTHSFKLSSLRERARFDSFHRDFLWLVHAGVGLKVSQVTEARCPRRSCFREIMFRKRSRRKSWCKRKSAIAAV